MVTLDRSSLAPDALTTDLERLEKDTLQLRRALNEVRVTAESPDGYVVATVGGRGELVELTLDPRIYRMHDAEALAADIMVAIRAGAKQAQQQVFAAAKHLLPPDATAGTSDVEFDPFLHRLAQTKGRPNP